MLASGVKILSRGQKRWGFLLVWLLRAHLQATGHGFLDLVQG